MFPWSGELSGKLKRIKEAPFTAYEDIFAYMIYP